MHTLNRLLVVTLSLLVLIPTGGMLAVLSLQEREEAVEELQGAIHHAAQRYRQRGGLQAAHTKAAAAKAEQEKQLSALRREKRQVRLSLRSILNDLATVGRRYDIDLSSVAAIEQRLEVAKRDVAAFLREEYRQRQTSPSLEQGVDGEWVLAVTGDRLEQRRGVARDGEVRTRTLQDLVLAKALHGKMAEEWKRYDEVHARQAQAQNIYDNAVEIVSVSEAELAEIQRIMAKVHNDILRMQGALARIDAQIREKAERTLIEKGLIDERDSERRARSLGKVQFQWPVYGTLTAGFREASYHRYFGVPHHGQDIAVPQGSPVGASADGIVFLVRDGGKKGYTYILIGHRDGNATLYGHLSATSVIAGQEVGAGQIIGLSGGKPGTPGAGPMTTGPHLHFEVIVRGVNVDPKTVLP